MVDRWPVEGPKRFGGVFVSHFLNLERQTLARYLPGFDEALAGLALMAMEQPGNPALPLFRASGATGLLVPKEHGGHGATALDMIRVQRAIGCRSPSLAVATTMHHFAVATLAEMAATPRGDQEWLVLEGVANRNLLVASGFAEGCTHAGGVFASAFQAERTPDGLVLNGSKKPCSLSASMDLLTVLVQLPNEAGAEASFGVVLLAAVTPGISRRPFWGSWVLAGAESDEIVLHDVVAPESLLAYRGNAGAMDAIQERSFLWFESLIAASYLGIASALVERVLAAGRGTAADRAGLAVQTEGAMAALEGVARALDAGERGQDLLAQSLLARFAVQDAVEPAAARAAELLGEFAFIQSPEVGYLLATARALAFHPPSRFSAAAALEAYFAGGALRVG
jgi:alkylation response protein AidB-like acyl-CoA dehydrogenase